MTAQQLKNSILQMAVQGKLVPQDPNDEPASVLLERIRAEKEQLIKEKKIKKEKNPSVIFRGADNLPYEKVGKNEPVCIADEVPFDIPDSWEWVRLGSIGDWGSGATPSRTHPEYYGGNIPWLKTGDLNDGYINSVPEFITDLALEKTSVRLNPIGSVLIAMYGATIGKLGILSIPATTNQACCACLPYSDFYNEYLFYFLMSQKQSFIKRGEGGAQPNISKEKIISTLMPVPPVEEQHRIVNRLKILLPLIEKYANTELAVDRLNKDFPEALKRSILQWAVQGKLVPQDPSDEPAEALLERIREEKQRLIREGKIKKDKHESIIFRRDNSHYEKLDGTEYCIDNELPFEIPENWCWVRLRSIVYNRGQATPNTAFCYIDIGSIDNKNQKLNAAETIIFPDKAPSRARKLVDKGDILYSTVRPYLHNMCIIDREFSQVPIASTGFAVLACHTGLLNKFLFYYMMSPDFDAYANNTDNAKGVAYPAISDARLYKALIPLPPFSEQQRIIQRIDELLPLVKGL